MITYKIINKFKTYMTNNNKINIKDKKIIFLGCGSIAKCCLYYLTYFFIFDYKNIIIIDKLEREKDYPVVKYYLRKKSIFLVKEVTEENYVEFFNSLQLKEKDIIIDLTTETDTLCFFKYCRLNNLFYINTASEQYFLKPINSIAIQHYNYDDIVRKTNHCNNVTTLIEYGMNPGLISSFVLKGIDDLANHFINVNCHNNSIDNELINYMGWGRCGWLMPIFRS